MVIVTKTYTVVGLEGYEVQIESDSARALPGIEIIGLPDAAVKEAKERIRAAFRNSGVEFPPRRMILNLAPSHLRKTGTSFDLSMAVALLALIEGCEPKMKKFLFFGELGLDGGIRRVDGLLPAVFAAIKKGFKNFVIPEDNYNELAYIPDIVIYPVKKFAELIPFVREGELLKNVSSRKKIEELYKEKEKKGIDFGHIKGHAKIKRCLTIAAAGGHNVLLIGSPGSGKTMLSKALQSILPPLSFKETMDVSQIYSVIGALSRDLPLITTRPFRKVHHTASKVSIVGGGQYLSPGEVSLAHKGILFFDELAEFPREVLEVLRQPLEDKNITISRATGTVTYPADFMFVASMNPCKCGYYGDTKKPCKCSEAEIKRYQSKISGPLLDRIDMILVVPRESIEVVMSDQRGDSSRNIKNKVVNAWMMQKKRFEGTDLTMNSGMSAHNIEKLLKLSPDVSDFVKQAAKKLHLSVRVVHRSIKLARTIADLDGSSHIRIKHVAEAMQCRNKSMFVE